MRIGEGRRTTVSYYLVLVPVVVVVKVVQRIHIFPSTANSRVCFHVLLPGLLDQLQRMAKKDEPQLRAELRRRHLPVENSTSNTKLLSRLRRP